MIYFALRDEVAAPRAEQPEPSTTIRNSRTHADASLVDAASTKLATD
ncbi:MAG: hypothetical protein JWN23_636 [Rhodocyclales bacterium]|nr:hypothetical protein [Rhodocyclales bacterium]